MEEKRPVRSAESSRVSSGKFADHVALMSVNFFREHCPPELLTSYKQTVVATMIMMRTKQDSRSLSIVSMGAGTKVCGYDSVAQQKSLSGGSLAIRDSHAEVLARRGLVKFLHCQLESATGGSDNSIFQRLDRPDEGNRKFALAQGVTFHLYTSSQPCGNASIKRWAKVKPVLHPESTSEFEYTVAMHSRIQITESGRKEGQTALLVKCNRHTATDGGQSETQEASQIAAEYVVDPELAAPYLPAGTALPSSGLGNVMTCSDKIALWNAVGLQGTLLSSLIDPVYLSTITVGRKFSKVHCERALCCRLQDFCYPQRSTHRAGGHKRSVGSDSTKPSGDSADATVLAPNAAPTRVYNVHHPTMLGTAVKLDEGAIVTAPLSDAAGGSEVNAGASFADPRCVCCYLDRDGTYAVEVIDGHSGLAVQRNSGCGPSNIVDSNEDQQGASAVSSAELLKSYLRIRELLCDRVPSDDKDDTYRYGQLKRAVGCPTYCAAKDHLRSDPQLFGEWVRKYAP
jgi:hypothetical protein